MQDNFRCFKSLNSIDCLLIGSGILILLIGNFSHIDLVMADTMFDQARGQFAWQVHRLTETSAYLAFQYLLMASAIAAMALALLDGLRPCTWLAPHRTGLRVFAGSAVLIPAAITLFSLLSEAICPVDLQRYGGVEAYTRLIETAPERVAGTNCLPASESGHVWWLLALMAFWIPRHPRIATAICALLLLGGLLLGYMLQLQGTQFFTQTLWSAWIACYLVYFLYHFFRTDETPQPRNGQQTLHSMKC